MFINVYRLLYSTGTIFRLTRGILCMSFMDGNGVLMTSSGTDVESSRCESPAKEYKKPAPCHRQTSQQSIGSLSMYSDAPADNQFVIICSERHARVRTQKCYTALVLERGLTLISYCYLLHVLG